jgi:hypothetical protein
LPDLLAQTRQVIVVEQQGHGRAADIGRPMSVQAMAGDTLALLASPGIGRADLFGYSLGAGIALASVTYDKTGLHPEVAGGPESGEPAEAPGRDLQMPFRAGVPGDMPDWLGRGSSLVSVDLACSGFALSSASPASRMTGPG